MLCIDPKVLTHIYMPLNRQLNESCLRWNCIYRFSEFLVWLAIITVIPIFKLYTNSVTFFPTGASSTLAPSSPPAPSSVPVLFFSLGALFNHEIPFVQVMCLCIHLYLLYAFVCFGKIYSKSLLYRNSKSLLYEWLWGWLCNSFFLIWLIDSVRQTWIVCVWIITFAWVSNHHQAWILLTFYIENIIHRCHHHL